MHFNLLAITSRSAYLAKQFAELEKTKEEEGEGGKEWTDQQIGEVKERLGRVEKQFQEWEVENALRRHNYVGLVRWVLFVQQKKC